MGIIEERRKIRKENGMKNFEVEVHRTMCNWITVEANSEDEAYEIVHKLAEKDHHWWDYYNEIDESKTVADDLTIEVLTEVELGYEDCCTYTSYEYDDESVQEVLEEVA